jgi:hypothetical protein
MSIMSAGRAILRAVRRRRSYPPAGAPPVFWGRIGEYEAVCRSGVLFLLSPEPAHPSLRVSEALTTALPPATPPTMMVC